MKKIFITAILTFLFVLGLSGAVWAESVTLEWDANTESDLDGYKIYTGLSTGTYDSTVDVGNVTTYTVLNLTAGTTYYFVATAYDTSGLESGYSNEVSYTAIDVTPPNAPSGFRIFIITP